MQIQQNQLAAETPISQSQEPSFHERLKEDQDKYEANSHKEDLESQQQRRVVLMNLTLDPSSIKELVIQHQNIDKGYYCYENWQELHNIIFGRSEEVFAHMWRTLKLINFGDDYIPTGLIYDTLVTLFNIERDTSQNEPVLQKLFFRFIELNGKVIFQHQKSQINYLKILKRLVQQYRILIQKRLSQKEYQVGDQEKPRFERLHHLHDLYVYRKNLEKLKKIDQQMKQCTFQPQLSASRYTMESRYWRQPIKKLVQIAPEEQLFESNIFRAKPKPQYPNRYPTGYSSHTARIKQTYEQKQLRKNMKPAIRTGERSQFSIDDRNSIRKINSFANKKVLFIIEIEVGKRRFMLKVREGMSTEEVTNIIERTAGLSDPEISDIVEEYFNNYFKRLNKGIEV